MVFEKYANYYDTIYADKHYQGEVQFVQSLLAAQNPIHSVLDLGCGTGGHAIPLARAGIQVTGVDFSEQMLASARQKALQEHVNVDFLHADIRSLRLDRTYDAVISMFAVMGYQTSNEDFLNALHTARAHLLPGRRMVFDAWFGPAVLSQRPEERVKELLSGDIRIIRIARPDLNVLANTVTVTYTILRLQGDRVVDETKESHLMRYLFDPEVHLFAGLAGFKVLQVCPFMQPDRQPTEKDWNVTWVLEAV